jgi:hypothetical protein
MDAARLDDRFAGGWQGGGAAPGTKVMPRKRSKSERGRGRPYFGTALYERVHWAEWVEECAEEYRQEGNLQPYYMALLELLELIGQSQIPNDNKRLKQLEKNFKKKRLKGRRESWLVRQRAEILNNYGQLGRQRALQLWDEVLNDFYGRTPATALRSLHLAEPTASPPTAAEEERPLTKQDLKAYLSDPAVRRDLNRILRRRRR